VAIAAHIEISRRGSPRRTLRLEALGATAAGDSASVAIHNISQTGLLIETDASLTTGEAIELDLPEAGLVEARVIWLSDRFAGCQFAQPISVGALGAAQLRGEFEGTAQPVATEPVQEPFPLRFARLRKERGLTLAAVAAALGVSKPTVWAWEQGKARPVESRIDALAEVLEVDRSALAPDRDVPRLDDSPSLAPILARSRAMIATALGIRPERVRISIDL